MIQRLVGAILALWIVAGVAHAAPVVSVSSWLAPSYNSQYAGQASQNAVQALYQGASTYGASDTPAYYAGSVTSLGASQIVMTSGFTAWNGLVNPTGNFENEHGNEAAFAASINGNGTQISASQIAFNATSSDPGNLLGFDYTFTGYGTDQYGTTVLGVIHGQGDDTFITSGSSDQVVDALFIAGLTNGLVAPCFGCSEADQEQAMLDAAGVLPPGVTHDVGTFIWNPGGGGIPNNAVQSGDVVTGFADLFITNGNVAEPTSLSLVLLLLGVGGFQAFLGRIRKPI